MCLRRIEIAFGKVETTGGVLGQVLVLHIRVGLLGVKEDFHLLLHRDLLRTCGSRGLGRQSSGHRKRSSSSVLQSALRLWGPIKQGSWWLPGSSRAGTRPPHWLCKSVSQGNPRGRDPHGSAAKPTASQIGLMTTLEAPRSRRC